MFENRSFLRLERRQTSIMGTCKAMVAVSELRKYVTLSPDTSKGPWRDYWDPITVPTQQYDLDPVAAPGGTGQLMKCRNEHHP